MITDFRILSSGSSGNAYFISSDNTNPLLLEAGLTLKVIRHKIGYKVSYISGCLISHEHQDHAKGVKQLLNAGIDCYMSKGTAQALNIEGHHRIHADGKDVIIIDNWYIMKFPLVHDAAEPIGYFIANEDDRLLFVPDTCYVKNRFNGITMMAVECNHIDEILRKNDIHAGLRRRIRHNHMSLKTLIKMLNANDLSQCRAIYLLHLSDTNSDERLMVQTVQEETGVPCYTE